MSITQEALLEELYLVENDYHQELEDIEREMEFATGRAYDDLAKNQATILDKLDDLWKEIRSIEDELGEDEYVDGCNACNSTGEGQFEGQSCSVCKGKGY